MTVVDNGVYSDGRHVITISTSSGYEKIRYTIDGGVPTTADPLYENDAKTYQTIDGAYYNGILVSVGSTVKAVSYRKRETLVITSFMGELTVEERAYVKGEGMGL